VNRWCKHLTAVSDGRVNDAHARIVLPIELHTKMTPVRHVEHMFQIWWKSVHKLRHILDHRRRTDGRTDGRTFTWFYSLSNAYA